VAEVSDHRNSFRGTFEHKSLLHYVQDDSGTHWL